MRKHINNFVALHAAQFKEVRKSLTVKRNPRYIYTEADLGEGLLDAGVSYDQQDNLHTKPWKNMLKVKWS
jgi:hypothetical protein